MAIQTQIVTGRLSQPNGEPVKSGSVRFTLSKFDAANNGVIAASSHIDVQVENDGSIALELWPNTAGLKGTRYSVSLISPSGRKIEDYGFIRVGVDGPYALSDLLLEDAPPAATTYWKKITQAEFDEKIAAMDARVSTAETARDIAVTARDTTIAARDAAAGSANAAYANAQDVASALVYQNLAGVLASYNLNIVDAFVYDTTKDFMGGLWRYQCQGKSWFDEEGAATGRWLGVHVNGTEAYSSGGVDGDYFYHPGAAKFFKLNEGTTEVFRGPRREFPANAIITAEADRVVIWDGDDPSLPMWRVISGGSDKFFNTAGGGTITSVTASNGWIVGGTTTRGISRMNLISEEAYIGLGAMSYRITSPIASYITGTVFPNHTVTGVLFTLASAVVNDVAITTLPGAPIDPETGMPIPTIACGTDGGVSVIRDDGSVVDVTSSAYTMRVQNISFSGDKLVLLHDETSSSGKRIVSITTIPAHDQTWPDPAYLRGYGAEERYIWTVGGSWAGDLQLPVYATVGTRTLPIGGELMMSGAYGLGRVARNSLDPTKGMTAAINTKHTSGWMIGDTKGAWLADTDASDLVGGELVTNGTFDVDATGWTFLDASSHSVENGQLTFTNDGNKYAKAYQALNTVIGQTYTITVDLVSVAGTGPARVYQSIHEPQAGTAASSNVLNTQISGTTANYSFVAINTTTYIVLSQRDDMNQSVTYDNISVRRADPDRSVNGKGLTVHGTVARTPVAEGAELVAYSGFSATNYLQQPYNPAMSYGVGDFYVMGWGKATGSGDYYIIDARDATTGPYSGFLVYRRGTDNTLRLNTYENGSTFSGVVAPVTNSTDWFNFTLFRKSGILYAAINGVICAVSNDAVRNVNQTIAQLGITVGISHPLHEYHVWPGSLALLRIGATAPTAEQIAKIYRDEKKLFQPGADCTLYGTSDAVTALAHDEDKGLLLAGTSGGLSRFDGLLRVSHADTPITTAIAAGAGYEVTQ